ncbi:Tim44/TimA family putative adaptor protein [Sphingomonas sp.]|uniref:Tim44/TimA family putative adaptor protein n=1 Tax=Sphingomonas sp. TaxID=28214 RepID=UPI002D808129|nr:Tim44/TimA family putative adaptor protein [Sphingomonas sp.]HEU0044567.1 Tim44/TimA family putative adaptor protein [Sphingomonas sp.]
MTVYIVVLAMVAAFLALRLYSVLGKRTGHEQRPLVRAAEDRGLPLTVPRSVESTPEPRQVGPQPIEPRAEQGVRAVIAGEPSFDVARFLDGSQAAYRMILEAYWRGDEAALDELCTAEVRDAFAAAIAARREAGETLENRLVRIDGATIVETVVQGRDARITVRFDADIAAVTRDAEGNVIAGTMTDAVETHDVWTFARTLKSSDPNWKLADTDEA